MLSSYKDSIKIFHFLNFDVFLQSAQKICACRRKCEKTRVFFKVFAGVSIFQFLFYREPHEPQAKTDQASSETNQAIYSGFFHAMHN